MRRHGAAQAAAGERRNPARLRQTRRPRAPACRDRLQQGHRGSDIGRLPQRRRTDWCCGLARPVQTQLTDGPGIFGYYSADKRYGTASTIAALYEVGRIWALRHPAPRVEVGDISRRGGGDIEGHASHETGRDADLRPMKNDGTEGPVAWQQPGYSRSLTQELIDIIYANGVVRVNVIGFNDPGVQGCINWVNHDNHLHVRFYFEDEDRVAVAPAGDIQLTGGAGMSTPPEQLATAAQRRGPAHA